MKTLAYIRSYCVCLDTSTTRIRKVDWIASIVIAFLLAVTGCVMPPDYTDSTTSIMSKKSPTVAPVTRGNISSTRSTLQGENLESNKSVNTPVVVQSSPIPAAVPPPDPAVAIEAARSEAQSDPRNWRAFYNLGKAYYRAGRFSEAVPAYQQAIALYPITTTIETEQKQQMAAQAAIESQQAAA